MGAKPWTTQECNTLAKLYANKSNKELAQILNRSAKAISSRAKVLGLRKSSEFKRNPYLFDSWTQQKQRAFIGDFQKVGYKRLAEIYQISPSCCAGIIKRLGLKKSEEFIKAHRYTPGHVPANKGKKQTEFMSAEAIERTKKGRFKKGQAPHNTKYNGYERTDADGYIYIRVAQGRFELKHRHVWEQANGPIEKGMNLVFKNENKHDCRLSNLELITNAELMQRNTIHNYPEEMKTAIRTLSRLNKKIKNYGKK